LRPSARGSVGGESVGVADRLQNSSVEQCIPAHNEVIEIAALVTEIAIGRPAAFAEQLSSDHHVHAAVDGPVILLAEHEPLDGRVADDRNQKAAFTTVFIDGVAQER